MSRAESTVPDAFSKRCKFDEAAGHQMERFIADFGQMYRERNQALEEVAMAHHHALLQLALAADFRDDDTGVHIVRIGFLAEALALKLGQPVGFAQMLRKAAPMHDVGKIGIPDRVLKKPGALSVDERTEMNRHASIGAEILGRSRIPLFQLAAEIALTHHERFDGSGYPAGMVGEAIPLSGRITAVVDFYDALTMDRCYRPAFDSARALEMMMAERGRAFDPVVIDAFIAHAEELEQMRCAIDKRGLTFQALIDGS